MEEIFNNNIEQRIKTLKQKGLSFRKIAEELNLSLGKVQRVLSVSECIDTPIKENSTGSDGVSENPQSVSDSVSECIDTPITEQTAEQNETVGDLKRRFNIVLEEFNKRLNEIGEKHETLKNEMSEEFNKRVGRVIKYALNNALEGLKTQIVSEIKGGCNKPAK